jgi:hypothetical protein
VAKEIVEILTNIVPKSLDRVRRADDVVQLFIIQVVFLHSEMSTRLKIIPALISYAPSGTSRLQRLLFPSQVS